MATLQRLAIGLALLCPALISAKPDSGRTTEGDGPAKFTCSWRGVYHYPADSGQDPVKFDVVMVQDGATVVGFMKEPNTFGKRKEPWLHAVLKGTVDEKTGKMSFVKTYDGTGGEDHDVKYEGTIARGAAKIDGTWAIRDFGGRFTLERVPETRTGAFAGVWEGVFKYPAGVKKENVKFKMILIHDGQNVVGLIKEPNTFGKRDEPWLQAGLKGFYDEKTGKLSFTKTYDGTGGEDHQVVYSGSVGRGKDSVQGTWTIGEDFTGEFTLQRTRLDAKTIRGLK